jgi:hypothetical protein
MFDAADLEYASPTNFQGTPGIWVRYARMGGKNIEVEPIPVLQDMIMHMNREMESLKGLQEEGTIKAEELEFYLKPIRGRIRLVEAMIDHRNNELAVKLVGNIINK